jgi:hypothetical protein
MRWPCGRASPPQFVQHVHSVGVRQAKVEDHGVVPGHAAGRQCLVGAPHHVNRKAPMAQVTGNDLAHREMILHEQYFHGRASLRVSFSSAPEAIYTGW